MGVEILPPNSGSPSGSGSASRRMRRPSLLSLGQTAGPTNGAALARDDIDTTGIGVDQHESVFGRPVPVRRTSDKIGEPSTLSTPHQPMPRWGPGGSFLEAARKRTTSSPALPFESLTTSTPPVDMPERPAQYGFPDEVDEAMPATGSRTQSPLRWVPNHMRPTSSSRKGKGRADDIAGGGAHGTSGSTSPESEANGSGGGQAFPGRPLPAPLLATLISETAPLEHEMRSEARLQRLLSSHSRASPFTPRAPRSSRGRFPETVGDDEDDDDNDLAVGRARAWTARHSRMGGRFSSDSDSDDDAAGAAALAGETVNSAFAAGMDMDRPGSSSSSSAMMFLDHHASGKSTPGHIAHGTSHADHSAGGPGQVVNPGLLTPGHAGSQTGFPTPPSGQGSQAWDRNRFSRLSFGNAAQGIASSPGTGIALPSAFGGLGMGTGTPLGSPTVERLEVCRHVKRPKTPSTDLIAGSIAWGANSGQSGADAVSRVKRGLSLGPPWQAERCVATSWRGPLFQSLIYRSSTRRPLRPVQTPQGHLPVLQLTRDGIPYVSRPAGHGDSDPSFAATCSVPTFGTGSDPTPDGVRAGVAIR